MKKIFFVDFGKFEGLLFYVNVKIEGFFIFLD